MINKTFRYFRRLELQTQFAIISFFVIFVMAALIGGVLAAQVRSSILDNFITHSRAIQRLAITDNLKKSDFAQDNDRLRGRPFDQLINNEILDEDIQAVKIWRADGLVLYSSDNKEGVGEIVKPKNNLEAALSGESPYGIERSGEAGIYSPVRFDGKVVGAFESYFSLEPVISATRKLYVTTITVFSLGSLLLWTALVGLVRKSARTINEQKEGLLQLNEELIKSLETQQENFLGTMESLSLAVESRDPATGKHSERLDGLITDLSDKLGLNDEEDRRLTRAGALHDIGKIGIPGSILGKPGPLTKKEWKIMQDHPDIGSAIVALIPFLKDIAPIIKHHHEHFNGDGYPDHLAGEDIPIESRILLVADAYDAMTSNRPYRLALSHEESMARLVEGKGTQFDPEVVDAFLVLVSERPDLFEYRKVA